MVSREGTASPLVSFLAAFMLCAVSQQQFSSQMSVRLAS
jgi:hypothetical protein